jgi:hypothetical protein
MREPTLDAEIVIVERPSADVVVYERVPTGARWKVSGSCNQCGLCVVGAAGNWYVWDGPPGTPGASRDTRVPDRLDDPVCPGFIEDMAQMAAETPTATVSGCSLNIEVVA